MLCSSSSMSYLCGGLRPRRVVAAATRTLATLLVAFVAIFAAPASGLSQDGVLLLQFKYSVIQDPLGALGDWNYEDATPCGWNGVMCMGFPDAATLNWTNGIVADGGASQPWTASRVIGLVLPNCQLFGSVPSALGLVEHLRHLDLSGNMLNGTIPGSLFKAPELRVLSLADNEISGELPEVIWPMKDLQVLNLSDNALSGPLPAELALLPNLTALSLANNYLYGELPGGGFERLEFLDLSSNLVNGSLPPDLSGQSLRYLNLSSNQLFGEIPPELGLRMPANATVDFSYNNLTGEIPQTGVFATQKTLAFTGNVDLCGKPLKNLCSIPSTLSDPPNTSATTPPAPNSTPAFAAMPRNAGAASPPEAVQSAVAQSGLRPAVVIAITVGDLVAIAILFTVFLYVYQVKKAKKEAQQQKQVKKDVGSVGLNRILPPPTPASLESKGIAELYCCLRNKGSGSADEDTEDTEEISSSSETETEEGGPQGKGRSEGDDGKSNSQQKQQQTLVTVDGEEELELETLLKASAYILGASGSSIVYKAVMADGSTLAVRRIGESSTIDKLKDLDAQVRALAKFRHPNLLRLRGFYWGPDEKLLIHDYAPNGSLANISFNRKLGSSPFHLSWEARLRIARGVARGLAYLHEKKGVHGNVKPSNILLDADMEPKIADFGLDKLVTGDGSYKLGTSARQFGSKRSTSSLPDHLSPLAGPSPSPCGSSSASALLSHPPYQAPESLKSLKPTARWDVYAFGMVLLELIAGRVFSDVELCQWNAGFVAEERSRAMRMADPAIRGELEGKEEALLSCFKLGFACCGTAPQKRPSMKEAVQVLERVHCTCSASS